MGTTPSQQLSHKLQFWHTWQVSPTHPLERDFSIGAYTADFAHLSTKTIIEIDCTAPDPLRDQIRHAGWQIVQMRSWELERDIPGAVHRISKLLTNKGVYLQKKAQTQINTPIAVPTPVVTTIPQTPVPPQPVCPGCGKTLAANTQLCTSCETQHEIRQRRLPVLHWARQLMLRDDWVIFDTETTGFLKTSEIIEIAIVDAHGQPVIDTLIKPSKPIPRNASKVHGISQKDVLNAPTFAEIWPRIFPIFQQKLVIAYNIAFDLRLLTQTVHAYGLQFPSEVQHDCLLKKYREYRHADPQNRAPSNALEVACDYFGITPGQHRALGDTLASWEVLKKLSELDE